jgi:Regulator of chromosome condensation (RCC1) repeat
MAPWRDETVLQASAIPGVPKAVRIALAKDRGCVLDAEGRVYCWGDNAKRAAVPVLTDARVEPATLVDGVSDAVEIALTGDASCARTRAGTVVCWGILPTGLHRGPARVIDGDAVQLVAGGLEHRARLADETLRCWPRPLGMDIEEGAAPGGVVQPKLDAVVGLTSSAAGTCAWSWDGTAHCWGSFACGQGASLSRGPCLGQGTGQLAVSQLDVCGSNLDGAVSCTASPAKLPFYPHEVTLFPPGRDAPRSLSLPPTRQLVADDNQICALGVDDEVRCWAPETGVHALPTLVERDAAASLMRPQQGCVRNENATVACSYDGSASELVRDASGTPIHVTRLVRGEQLGVTSRGELVAWPPPPPERVVRFDSFRGAQYAITAGGQLRPWPRSSPTVVERHGTWGPGVLVPGVGGLVDVVHARGALYALLADGRVAYERCADRGCRPTADLTRRTVEGIAGARAIAASGEAVCAITDDGVRCFPAVGPEESVPVPPTPIAGIGAGTAIAAGQGHFCAIVDGGGAACWGQATQGQLGDGTLDSRAEGRRVPDLTDVVELHLADWSSCAKLRDGSFRCWGNFGESTAPASRRIVRVTGLHEDVP